MRFYATKSQKAEAQRFINIVGIEEDVDEAIIDNDEAYEILDNIATEEYEKKGGKFKQNFVPTNPSLFEDCILWAKDFIEDLRGKL